MLEQLERPLPASWEAQRAGVTSVCTLPNVSPG